MGRLKRVDNGSLLSGENQSTPSDEQVKEDEVVIENQSTPSEIQTIDVSFEQKEPLKNDNDVRFKVSYNKSFTGKKWFKDGDVITTSKESASLFTKQGIGTII